MSNAVYDTHLININKLKLKRKATSSPPIPYLLKPNQSFIKLKTMSRLSSVFLFDLVAIATDAAVTAGFAMTNASVIEDKHHNLRGHQDKPTNTVEGTCSCSRESISVPQRIERGSLRLTAVRWWL